MKENNFANNDLGGKIEKISVPDSDMAGWIKVLMEAGFSEEERDEILINLNKTYRDAKLSREEQVRRMIKYFEDELYRKNKIIMRHYQRERVRKAIEQKFDLEEAEKK